MIVKNDLTFTTGSPSWVTGRFTRVGWKHQPFNKALATPLDYDISVQRWGHRIYTPLKPASINTAPTIAQPSSISNFFVNENGIGYDGTPFGPVATAAYNTAYAKFKTKIQGGIGAQASLGVSVAEGREAVAGIIDRATRLGRAYKALRKGRFKTFLKQLGGRPMEKHKKTHFTRPKDASALWLEYWLAWAPLVGDIRACVGVLTSTDLHPPVRVKAGRTLTGETEKKHDGGNIRLKGTIEYRVRCEISATAKVVNENAYLADRMGLKNYAGIVWAVVPFSFIIDWFGNIGDILDSYTDFVGVEFNDIQVNCLTYSSDTTTIEQYGNWGWDSDVLLGFYTVENCSDMRFKRVVNLTRIPAPRLQFEVDWGTLTPTRAATAISLLLSIFTRG